MTDTQALQPDLEELDLLRRSVRRLFGGGPSLSQAAELGLLGLLTPEQVGGSGWRPVEACVVAEEAGRSLSPLAWTGNTLLAAALASTPKHEVLGQSLLAGTACGVMARANGVIVDESTGRLSGRWPLPTEQIPDVVLLTGERLKPTLIDCRADGVGFETAASMDTTRPGGLLVVQSARPEPVENVDMAPIVAMGTLLSCADSLGALSATILLLTDHLCQRMAFDKPLASFQIIQHRLADLAILEAACTALIRTTSLAVFAKSADAGKAVAATQSYFSRHVTVALDDCIQLAGGIGFTWEYPVHHAMRRCLANDSATRTPLNTELLQAPALPEPDGRDREFRSNARALIQRHAPFEMREGHRAPTSAADEKLLRTWYRNLYEHGLAGASWPVEWGGNADHQPVHDLIIIEELIRARAPRPIDQVQLASHLLLRFGTDVQQAQYLPKVRTAEHIWCQLFSEPDCGSDLAGIKARAELLDDGSWRFSGQKTWTTDAHWAQMGIALMRTSRGSRRHDGITAFLVPMDTPGVDIKPKLTIGGAFEFNDVFLDGVILPPEQLLGAVGQGWQVAMSGLEVERFGVGGNVLLLALLLEDLFLVTESLPLDFAAGSRIDSEMTALVADARAAHAFITNHVEMALAGDEAPADASIAKVLYTETYNRIARYGAETVTRYGPVPPTVTAAAERLTDAWLWSRALTISGGSSEVMRNIIAKRRLRLPQ